MKTLSLAIPFRIRFSEVDAMRVVWHGSYVKYLEDAREAFGEKYGLSYDAYIDNGCFAPIVDMHLQYKRPLRYGMHPEIVITYRPTEAAKVVFDYEIRDTATGEVMVTGHTLQVFMNTDYELLWDNPPFYEQWKKQWLIDEE